MKIISLIQLKLFWLIFNRLYYHIEYCIDFIKYFGLINHNKITTFELKNLIFFLFSPFFVRFSQIYDFLGSD
jgi:hypothetical protein